MLDVENKEVKTPVEYNERHFTVNYVTLLWQKTIQILHASHFLGF